MQKRNTMKKHLSVFMALSIALTAGFFTVPMPDVRAGGATQQYYQKGSGGYRNVMYYGDWSTGAPQGYFNPDDIPADKLTHLNFAFLDFDRYGNLLWGEKEASVDHVVGIEGAVQGAENAGILSGLVELRAKNPNLRIGVSVGGWAKSGDFSEVAKNETLRRKLADNLADFVKYTQMDFVDIDWEYPGNVRQAEYMDNQTNEGTPHAGPDDFENYVLLLQDIRASLDRLSKEVSVPDYAHWDPSVKFNKYYELSVAISANSSVLAQGTDIKAVFEICDYVNVMTYDTTGHYEAKTGHHTALYTNPQINNQSIDNTVQYLLSQGATASKIVVGCAFYTRGWEKASRVIDNDPSDGDSSDVNINGLPGLGWTATAVTPGTNGYKGNANGTAGRGADNYQPTVWGDGGYAAGIWPIYNMDDLRARYPDLEYYYDETAQAPYLYDLDGAFFTFDDERSITAKATYVKQAGLGGMIAWMQSQDGETVAGSNVRDRLTTAMKNGLFGENTALPKYDLFPEGPDFGITYAYNETTKAIDITLRNKAKLSESNAVLKEVEESYKTIFTPTIYLKLKDGYTLTAGNNSGSVAMAQNNIAIVYLYEAAPMLYPGQNYTFSLQPSAPNSYGIDSIVVTQRIVPTGTEFYYKLMTWSPWEAVAMFDTPKPKAIEAPQLSGANANLIVGKSHKFSVLHPVGGATYNWQSSNSKVATVQNGLVNAVGSGTATITCDIKTANHTYSLKAAITVQAKPTLSDIAKTIEQKTTFHLSVRTLPPGSSTVWKSSNERAVKVSSNGIVTAVAPGTANVTATVRTPDNTIYTLVSKITVPSLPVLSSARMALQMGKTATLSVKNSISGAASSWKSSNNTIASVNQRGVVKALKTGTATVTCTINSKGNVYQLKATLTVTGPKLAKARLTVQPKKSVQIALKSKIAGSKYTYKSAKPSIAKVSSKGKITGVKKGTTTITVTITFPQKLKLKKMALKVRINVK
jgi:chitinase